MKSALRYPVLVAAMATALSSTAFAEPGVSENTIRRGTFGPLTGPGSD